ncbi:peptidoglycan synthetase FtsI [Magnetococcus marinus MC-1]|uniref:Peptidoglycan synthetase FtsI n=1 Tax=Magnetococcus marinus (strain ATCC BAA-1437 / JCM 17883 / MC-1) TaxID=156889 RepID=A0L5N7_MAGMM|nr:peptidoglycan synthetase FtsI [Magnetococcus marinus MC-1]
MLGVPKNRLDLIIGLFMLAFVILTVRAVDLSILQGPQLREMAEQQHERRIPVPANRGLILDRHGRTLGISLPMKTLSVDASRIQDPEHLASMLYEHLGMSKEKLIQKLRSAKPGSFPIIKRQIPPMEALKISRLDLDELFFLPESKRVYPMGEVTAHVVGYTNFNGEGREGMEGAFNDHLKGKPGTRLIVRDRLGRLMPGGTSLERAEPGTDLVLTIDANIQYIAYRALLKSVRNTNAKAGTVVVMNPNNGEILALVNQPSYNPNDLRHSQDHQRRNRAIMDTYEPGSTFKIFTVAAALDKHIVTPDHLINAENGRFRVADRIIQDFSRHKILTVSQVLQKSSNIGAAKIGLLTGLELQESYLQKFGFGSGTGIELPYEARGRIPDVSQYRQVGLASRSYGYGITATPLQLVTAASAVVNGGLLYPPRLVARQVVKGHSHLAEQAKPVRVINASTSKMMRDILKGVVDPDGTAPEADVEGYSVAGKTGTARKAGPKSQGYDRRYFASFVGFVPAQAPQLVIYVSIDEPQGKRYYGGQVAAPVFQEIAEEVLPLLAVLPETRRKNKTPLPPIDGYVFNPDRDTKDPSDVKNASLANALQVFSRKEIIPLVSGSGKVQLVEEVEQGQIRLTLQ